MSVTIEQLHPFFRLQDVLVRSEHKRQSVDEASKALALRIEPPVSLSASPIATPEASPVSSRVPRSLLV